MMIICACSIDPAGFSEESRFRTWLYRVAVNQVFTFKTHRADQPVYSYEEFSRDLDQTPDGDLHVLNDTERQVLIEEAKIICTMAMLLCLDGRQRAAYILGEIFAVTDDVGTEVLDTTPVNFRQILSRARKENTDLTGWERYVKLFDTWMDPRFKATVTEIRDLKICISRYPAVSPGFPRSLTTSESGMESPSVTETSAGPEYWRNARVDGSSSRCTGLWPRTRSARRAAGPPSGNNRDEAVLGIFLNF